MEAEGLKEQVRVKGTWDRSVDYEAMYRKLSKAVARGEGVAKCYAAVALIQLRNGSRISEAVDAFMNYLASGAEVVQVKVRKKKRGEEHRVMKIPPALSQSGVRESCRELLVEDRTALRDRVRWWVRRNFAITTHSLRYAFVTHALLHGWDFAVVSKAIRHQNPSLLQRYVQRRVADDVLLSDEFDPE